MRIRIKRFKRTNSDYSDSLRASFGGTNYSFPLIDVLFEGLLLKNYRLISIFKISLPCLKILLIISVLIFYRMM